MTEPSADAPADTGIEVHAMANWGTAINANMRPMAIALTSRLFISQSS